MESAPGWVIRSAQPSHGPSASFFHPPPRYQQLYVRTADIIAAGRLLKPPPRVNRIQDLFGKVVTPGDWDLQHGNREMTWKRRTLVGLAAGLGPKQSGYVDRMEAVIARKGSNHGCTDYADIIARARALESMIEQIRQDCRLKERSELGPYAFRERGGIGVAVGRDGTVYRVNGDGGHRMVFAEVLGIQAIPVAVTAVHPDAIRNGAYKRLLGESRSLRIAAFASAQSLSYPKKSKPSRRGG